MKMEQSVPKRRHMKFRRRGITLHKTYNNTQNHFTLNTATTSPTLTKLTLGRHHSVGNTCTEFHKNSSNRLVFDKKSQTERRGLHIGVLYLLRKEIKHQRTCLQ
jgi:hypothetical protein